MHVLYSVNPEKLPCGATEALSMMLFQHAIICKISLNMLFVRCLTRSSLPLALCMCHSASLNPVLFFFCCVMFFIWQLCHCLLALDFNGILHLHQRESLMWPLEALTVSDCVQKMKNELEDKDFIRDPTAIVCKQTDEMMSFTPSFSRDIQYLFFSIHI